MVQPVAEPVTVATKISTLRLIRMLRTCISSSSLDQTLVIRAVIFPSIQYARGARNEDPFVENCPSRSCQRAQPDHCADVGRTGFVTVRRRSPSRSD